MKISTMMRLGFGIVILLLLLASGSGFFGMEMSSNAFQDYRGMARDTNLVGRLQANMLSTRLAVKNYTINGEEQYLDTYRDHEKLMTEFIEEAKKEIKNPERARKVIEIEKEVEEYVQAFAKVVEMQKKQEEILQNRLNPNGTRIRTELTRLADALVGDKEHESAVHVYHLQEKTLLGRIYALKFLQSHGKEDVERVGKELGEGLEADVAETEKRMVHGDDQQGFKNYKNARTDYLKAFTDIVTTANERDHLIVGTLDRIGPNVAKLVEDVKLSIKNEQDALGPKVQAQNQQTLTIIGSVSVFALLAAIFLTLWTTKQVLRPLGGEPALISRQLGNVADGDLSVDVNVPAGDTSSVAASMKRLVEAERSVAAAVEKLSLGNLDVDLKERSGKDTLLQSLKRLVSAEKNVVGVVQKLADGDLRMEVKERSPEDTLLIAVRETIARLNNVMGEILAGADNVASGSQEMSATAEEMSQGATEQAASLEESTSAMEEMAANINQNADNAKQTEAIALRASQDARESGEAVNKTVSAMREIAGKISIIEEIARQTDLLALNAAIEAARAGDQGRGFAVVASEVRKLAERSQAAAAEINHLSTNSTAVAEKAGELLTKLVPDIQKTSELVQEIAAASREQSAGAEQVNQALQQLDQVVQQNAAASEEMAATSEELAAQSDQLQGSISFFKIREDVRHVSSGNKRVREDARGVKSQGKSRAVGKATIAHAKKPVAQLQAPPRKGAELHLEEEPEVDEGFERY